MSFPDLLPHFPLLVLEAATTRGSVALFLDENRCVKQSVTMGVSREDALLPAVDRLCRQGGVSVSDVRSVVCGSGPGSFTSLRIAASLAKGIAYANDARLYAISSLLLAASHINGAGEFLLHADALRGERFVQRVRVDDRGIVYAVGSVTREPAEAVTSTESIDPALAGSIDVNESPPDASSAMMVDGWMTPVGLDSWEPMYGRLAEAQVKWETTHGRALSMEPALETLPSSTPVSKAEPA